MALSCTELKRELSYDPVTGLFTRLVSRSNRSKAGTVAGGKMAHGYVHIGVLGKQYLAHHLAVLYMTGHWPTLEIDHRNGDQSDNRWDNLREATSGQNKANTKRRIDNTSGYKGVQFHPQTGKWRARLRFHGKYISLGLHDDPEIAHAAYVQTARQLYGEFARAA